jgi:hypothetical protein
MQQGLRDGFREMMNPGGQGGPSTMQSSTLVGSGTGYDETEARMRELNAPFYVKLRRLVTGSLNFYRVHMLYFIIVSLARVGKWWSVLIRVDTAHHVGDILRRQYGIPHRLRR